MPLFRAATRISRSRHSAGLRPRAAAALLIGAALALSGCGGKTPPSPNLILISIDTLRSDHLGCYGYPRPTSPMIDSLASTGAVFEHATAQSPWTLPSHVTLLSSTFPFTHGSVEENCRIAPDLPLLAEVLKANGYRCGAAVSAFFVGRFFGFDRGFDDFEDFDIGKHEQRVPGRKVLGDSVTDWGLAWIGRSSEPFFLFLHYFDAHVNYVVPEPYRSLFEDEYSGPEIRYQSYPHYKSHPLGPAEERHVINQYDAAIAYVDANIGRLVRTLKARGLADRTLIVITADHGEEFFERGSWGHGATLHRELLEVPLILVDPRRPGDGMRIPDPVRLLDVAPTVLDALGLGALEGAQGQSLWPLVTGTPLDFDPLLFAETSIEKLNMVSLTQGPLKLISNFKNESQQVYDLDQDPEERSDLAASDTSLTRRLLEETVTVGASLIPGRFCIRWQVEETDHRYAGTLVSRGVVVDASYRGYDPEAISLAEDRRTLRFTSDRSGEIRVAVVPVDIPVTLEFEIDGEPALERVFVGQNALHPEKIPFVFFDVVRTEDLLAPPPDLGPGFYVWKDPGDLRAAEPAELSEEAKEHLRALGYLH